MEQNQNNQPPQPPVQPTVNNPEFIQPPAPVSSASSYETTSSVWQNIRQLVWSNTALKLAIAAFALDFALLVASYMTNDYSTANGMSSMSFFVGVFASLCLGIGLLKLIFQSIDTHGGAVNTLEQAGIILIILSVFSGFIMVIPGILLLGIGLSSKANRKPVGNGARTMFGIGAFIGGGISGLLIAFLISATISMRACELSSSKCY